jgi:hypothetical protein
MPIPAVAPLNLLGSTQSIVAILTPIACCIVPKARSSNYSVRQWRQHAGLPMHERHIPTYNIRYGESKQSEMRETIANWLQGAPKQAIEGDAQ